MSIELRFDRYLEPDAAIRQSIRVFQRLNDEDVPIGSAFLQPEYDIVERVIVYRLSRDKQPNGLDPGTLYTVEVLAPAEAGAEGFRAFDGAPLSADGSVPLEFQFRTEFADSEWPPDVRTPTCQGVLDTFLAAGCRSSGCHNPNPTEGCPPFMAEDPNKNCVGVPRMGLKLDTPNGLVETAIRRVAHQTDVGSQAGVPLQNPARVGVAMPIIDPGKPGNSYLMYKLLRRPENFYKVDPAEACASRGRWPGEHFAPLPDGDCLSPTSDESRRLREWFVRGEPMPLNRKVSADLSHLHDIQRWIAAGAVCGE